MKMLENRVLIKPHKPEDMSKGGIIIPDSVKEKPMKGTVIMVGSGTKDEEMEVRVGDEVLYGKSAGIEIELEGEIHLILRQGDIPMIL